MDFGKKILEKYGYKDGQGLGKKENGITNAIRAQFKFDQKGFGSGELKEETNHWWERTFNDASNNINIDSSDNKIKIELNDKDGVEITNKSYSLKKLKASNKSLQYGNFLKAATLDGKEKDIENHVKTEDIEIKPIQVLSDQELLKACEYRTAHKGARHGLRLNGKLKRIADQERELLERMKANKSEIFKSNISVATKRKITDLNSSKEDDSSDEDKLPLNLPSETAHIGKTKKRKQKKELNCLVDQIENSLAMNSTNDSVQVHVDTPVKKSKKSKKKSKLENIQEESIEPIKAKKKSKKSKKTDDDDKTQQLLDDDEKMDEKFDLKPKRIKLDSSHEAATDEDEIDKINEIHHQKLKQKEPIILDTVNLDNSIKKKNKKKKKEAVVQENAEADESWEIQKGKKLGKSDKKKLKLELKLKQKMEKKRGKKIKKLKKKLKTVTDIFDAVEL
ncbi:hypothetical protein PVAND_006221 [Polypedilum vanderplanki]|uniref:G patch domain-containing protein 4 n=1 Tax=Polypedilum vanderplanki TaxID=319348 RepID=A0A9J6C2H9_POLVA|nr:hypothetical protein PVAND_006221 [Polypedilum vanderplanki]